MSEFEWKSKHLIGKWSSIFIWTFYIIFCHKYCLKWWVRLTELFTTSANMYSLTRQHDTTWSCDDCMKYTTKIQPLTFIRFSCKKRKGLNVQYNSSVRRHFFICWITLPADVKFGICKKKLVLWQIDEKCLQRAHLSITKNFYHHKYNYKVVLNILVLIVDKMPLPNIRKMQYVMIYFMVTI